MLDVNTEFSEDILFVAEDEIVEVMGKIGLHSLDDVYRRVDGKADYYQQYIVGKEFTRY